MITSAPLPHLVVDGAERAIAFCEQAFGAKCESKHRAEDGKRLMHTDLLLGSGALFLHDDFPEFGEAGGVKAPGRLGGTSLTLHDNQFWGQRYGKLSDPFGHAWSIGGPVKA